MDDVERYIRERAARDPDFADGFEAGYAEFKRDVMLRAASGEPAVSPTRAANDPPERGRGA
jgi:hypothetical protein